MNLHAEDAVTRKCTKDDLFGMWTITHNKILDQEKDKAPYWLINPYQVRIYKKDNSLWTISSNNEVMDKVKNWSQFPQDQSYSIKNGIVSTFDKNNQLIDMYTCDYFVSDFEKAKIPKGSISLIWYRKNKPSVASVFKKLSIK